MEAHRHFAKPGAGGRGQSLAGRRNSILAAVLSAVLAAVLIYLFVTHYKKSPTVAAPANVTEWVATRSIPKGTPESIIAQQGLLKPAQVPSNQALPGAIADPSAIAGEVSAFPIAAGQKITATDFTRTTATVGSYLKGNQRAVAFTLDGEHGLTTYLTPGDTVDVMGVSSTGSSQLLVQNVQVLANQAGIVVLKLTDRQSLLVTAATGTASLWLSLRPTIDATDSVQVGSVGK